MISYEVCDVVTGIAFIVAVLRSVAKIFAVIVVTMALLEGMLIITDPLGMAFFSKVEYARSFLGAGNGSYTLSPGTYDFGDWTVTMDETSTRHVPDASGECTVLFVGDSVTWGLGVNDEAVFANLLARDLKIKAINAGIFGYNTENVLATLALHENFDLGVYLIFPNDHEDAWQIDGPIQPNGTHRFGGFGLPNGDIPATVWYALYLIYQPQKQRQGLPMDRFLADMSDIAAYDNVLIFGFDDPLTSAASQHYDVHVIDWYTQQVSYADPHPNVVGHQQIAAAMRPFIETELERTCAGRFSSADGENL